MSQRLSIRSNWNVSCGCTLETLRKIGAPIYKCQNMPLAVMEVVPRSFRKFTVNNVYKHLTLDSWVSISDFISPTMTATEVETIIKAKNSQISQTVVILSEFLKLTAKFPDYLRLLYVGKPINHIYITDDWLVLGTAGNGYTISMPYPDDN